MGSEGEQKSDEYRSGGAFPAVVGLVCVVVIVGVGLSDPGIDFPFWGFPLAAFVLAGLWAVLLRPCVGVGASELHLRNVFHDLWVPYSRIDGVTITQVTRVRVGEVEYVGSGLGRTRHTMRRDEKRISGPHGQGYSIGLLVEQRIDRLIGSHQNTPQGSALQVRREWAWPVIGLVGSTAVATVVLALLGI
ncbi:MAG: hypothetical protein L0H31_07705 [Nocardioidaceae bacterium]|nr:hypothetical protein [Nocardioidaceae bacterium]